MNIQAPPNLSAGRLSSACAAAGLNDWGGVSPLTPDHINPERALARASPSYGAAPRRRAHELRERLAIYPGVQRPAPGFVDDRALRPRVARLVDARGPRRDPISR